MKSIKRIIYKRYLFIAGISLVALLAAHAPIHCAAEHHLAQEISQNLTKHIRSELEAAVQNKSPEERNELLQALLEHQIPLLPEAIKVPLLAEFLKRAFFAQQDCDDTYAMELLLEAKADPNVFSNNDFSHLEHNQESCSTLYVSILANNNQAVQLFLDHGADPSLPATDTDNNLSCLEIDCSKNIHALLIAHIMQQLKQKQVDPNYINPQTQQSLLSMVLNTPPPLLQQAIPLVQLLLNLGANPNCPNKKRPLPLCSVLEHKRMAEDENQEGLYKVYKKEWRQALTELENILRAHGAQEYAVQSQDSACVIQ